MKVETTSTEVFTPIELKITIETKRELEILYALFNNPVDSITNFCNYSKTKNVKEISVRETSEFFADIFYALYNKLLNK